LVNIKINIALIRFENMRYLRVNLLNIPVEMMQRVLYSKLGGCSVKH